MTANDQDLRGRFAALRRQVEAQAPGFTAPRVRSPMPFRSHSPAVLLAAAACLIAMATAGLWMRTAWQRPQPKTAGSVMAWKPPTDFLLETPGRELLRTVPAIGGIENGLIAPTHHRKKLKRDKARFAVHPFLL